MNNEEKIFNCLTWLVTNISMINEYNWDMDYSKKILGENFDKFNKEMKNIINFKTINEDLARKLRMKIWNEYDANNNLWLFPLYLTPIIPDGMEIIYIDGSKGVYKKGKMDNDIRFGCVCYGILIPKKKENKEGE